MVGLINIGKIKGTSRSWRYKLQRIVDLSTCEMKCRLLLKVAKEIVWTCNLLNKLHQSFSDPHQSFASMQIQSNYICERVEDKEIAVLQISMVHQVANTFTKPLRQIKLQEFSPNTEVVTSYGVLNLLSLPWSSNQAKSWRLHYSNSMSLEMSTFDYLLTSMKPPFVTTLSFSFMFLLSSCCRSYFTKNTKEAKLSQYLKITGIGQQPLSRISCKYPRQFISVNSTTSIVAPIS